MKTTDYKFSDPYIKESIFTLNEEFNRKKGNGIRIKTTAHAYTDYKSGQNENFAVGGLTIQIGEESSDTPFFAKVTMEAEFSWENKNEDEVKDFFKVNVPSLLTGYIRPIITFLTANSPYAPFHLEFINFAE